MAAEIASAARRFVLSAAAGETFAELAALAAARYRDLVKRRSPDESRSIAISLLHSTTRHPSVVSEIRP
jgi:hypothetical protein